MPRPGYVVVGWMAATAAAIGVAYAGVSSVAGGVVDPLPPSAGLPVTTPAEVTPAPTDPSSTGTTATQPPTTPTPTTAPTTAPASTPPSVDPVPTERPTSDPGSTAPASGGEVRSYALVGGSATLRYEPGRVTVVTAGPRQGFTVEVEGDGTAEVRVEFDSDEHRSRLRGAWEGGPRERIEEDADRDDGDDRHDD